MRQYIKQPVCPACNAGLGSGGLSVAVELVGEFDRLFGMVAPQRSPISPGRERLMDPWWRKARIGARLIQKREEGKEWSARDRRLAKMLAEDAGVTNRLLDQAWWSLRARKKYGAGLLGW